VLFRAAADEAPPRELIDEIEQLLELDTDGVRALRYEDRKRGQRRTVRLATVERDTRLEGVLLAGDVSAEGWIKALLQEQLPAQAYGRMLLAPGAKAPVALAPRGKQVCACFNVSEPQIRETLAACPGGASERLAQLQGRLRCGTNCGSCVPALKTLVNSTPVGAAPTVAA
jgi:assimilatory nitrate reductase catalytic subunit